MCAQLVGQASCTPPRAPTPAAARYRAAGDPRPPQPTMSTEPWHRRSCARRPKLGSSRCLLYRCTCALLREWLVVKLALVLGPASPAAGSCGAGHAHAAPHAAPPFLASSSRSRATSRLSACTSPSSDVWRSPMERRGWIGARRPCHCAVVVARAHRLAQPMAASSATTKLPTSILVHTCPPAAALRRLASAALACRHAPPPRAAAMPGSLHEELVQQFRGWVPPLTGAACAAGAACVVAPPPPASAAAAAAPSALLAQPHPQPSSPGPEQAPHTMVGPAARRLEPQGPARQDRRGGRLCGVHRWLRGARAGRDKLQQQRCNGSSSSSSRCHGCLRPSHRTRPARPPPAPSARPRRRALLRGRICPQGRRGHDLRPEVGALHRQRELPHEPAKCASCECARAPCPHAHVHERAHVALAAVLQGHVHELSCTATRTHCHALAACPRLRA